MTDGGAHCFGDDEVDLDDGDDDDLVDVDDDGEVVAFDMNDEAVDVEGTGFLMTRLRRL
jgi:hypothetical protein